MDFLLPIWNPFIVHPLMGGLRLIAQPLQSVVGPGAAGGLAIIIFTILLRVVLLPLSLVQIRSQRHQLAIQPELRALQKKFKGDREGLARAQMALYKERGVNPAAGCIPLLIQLPVLFGMYAAMSQLATQGLTLDRVMQRQIEAGRVAYAAERHTDPLPFNQFVLATFDFRLKTNAPTTVDIAQDQSRVLHKDTDILRTVQGLTITPGSQVGNPNPPNTPSGTASIFMRGGVRNPDGSIDHSPPVQVGPTYVVQIWVDASQTNADSATAVVTFDPNALDVSNLETPPLDQQDIAFKSRFLWLPSLGEPDVFHLNGLNVGIPGLLLIVMTITSFVSQRMTTMPTDDPQQQAMMRSMAFMPLMYLFFFLNTPSGLVLYWLVSNVFSMGQQYFTVGLGLLGGDLERLTGRDFQPAWAHVPGMAPPGGNGRIVQLDEDETKPAAGSREANRTGVARGGSTRAEASRRPRSGSGKGRKRGKR